MPAEQEEALCAGATPKGVGGLPEEVRHNVLGYLWGAAGGHVRDVLSVGLMNRSWERTVRMSSLWRNMLSGVLLERVQREHEGASMERICWKDAYVSGRRAAFSTVRCSESKSSSFFGTVKKLLTGSSKKKIRTFFYGLDSAGKSTILFSLLRKPTTNAIYSTFGFYEETLCHKNTIFLCIDTPWDGDMGQMWRHLYVGAKVIVFAVDAADPTRLWIGKEILRSMIADPQLSDSIFLVFANKQDVRGAITPEEIAADFKTLNWGSHEWCVQGCSAHQRKGLSEGLDWVVESLTR